MHNTYLDFTEEFNFIGWEKFYDDRFEGYLSLLNKRTQRLSELDKNSIDYITYRDIILVMLRAILIESPGNNKNYTVQNFLKRHNRIDLADKINDYLNQDINKIYTLREAIKIVVDKNIAHNENMVKYSEESKEEELDMKNIFCDSLYLNDIKNDNFPFTIEKIVATINNTIKSI